MDKRIENVCDSDIEIISDFEAEGFKEAFSEAELRRMLTLDYCIFKKLSLGGSIAAYSVFYLIAGEAELLKIYVTPDKRGSGLAYELISECEREISDRGGSLIHIEVRESNASARALYVKAGYEENGRRRDYYNAPSEDAILMHKHLGGAALK